MNAYKVELLIVDFDELGASEITSVLEYQRYPNWCISPSVMNVTKKDIGEWSDDHPLNKADTRLATYWELFGNTAGLS